MCSSSCSSNSFQQAAVFFQVHYVPWCAIHFQNIRVSDKLICAIQYGWGFFGSIEQSSISPLAHQCSTCRCCWAWQKKSLEHNAKETPFRFWAVQQEWSKTHTISSVSVWFTSGSAKGKIMPFDKEEWAGKLRHRRKLWMKVLIVTISWITCKACVCVFFLDFSTI